MLKSVCIAACIISFAVSTSGRPASAQSAEPVRSAEAKEKVVYALKDVQEGAIVEREAIEEREVLASRAPIDAIPAAVLAWGRVAKHGIPAGAIVSHHDLESPEMWPLLRLHLSKKQLEDLRSIAVKRKSSPEAIAEGWIKENLDRNSTAK